MRNVKKEQLKTCIFMDLGEFYKLIYELTNGLKEVKYEFYVYIVNSDKSYDEGTFWEEDINETLSSYFGVEVTSFHSDENECIWICFK